MSFHKTLGGMRESTGDHRSSFFRRISKAELLAHVYKMICHMLGKVWLLDGCWEMSFHKPCTAFVLYFPLSLEKLLAGSAKKQIKVEVPGPGHRAPPNRAPVGKCAPMMCNVKPHWLKGIKVMTGTGVPDIFSVFCRLEILGSAIIHALRHS